MSRLNRSNTKSSRPRTQLTNVKDIFGKMFIAKMMGHMRLKLYNFQELESEIKQKKDYKTEFRQYYTEKLSYYERKDPDQELEIVARAESAPEDECALVE